MSKLVILVRGTVLLSCLAVMPLLAIPTVGHWYDAWLLGELSPRPAATAAIEAKRVAHPAALPLPQPETKSIVPADQAQSREAAQRMAERFQAIPKRLQELGADYLRLESVDIEGQLFRFHCRMPLGESAAYSRPFEVTAADPVEAMEGVLAEVEAWREARERTAETRATSRQ